MTEVTEVAEPDTTIDDRTIARWRLANQRLTGPGLGSPAAVVEHLLAVQAENHAQTTWAIAARTTGTTDQEFAAAYDAGEILRTHVIRPTWHFVKRAEIGWLLELTRPRIWRTIEGAAKRDWGVSLAEIERGTAAIVDAIAEYGPLTRDELGERLDDDAWKGERWVLGAMMSHAELHGAICSGPLVEGSHTYALLDDRAPDRRRLDRDEALAELARRYFTSHGPATERDLAYWATLTLTDVRTGIAAVADELDTFEHDGRTYWHGDARPNLDEPAEPRGHILQLFDECYRGYQDSRWVLDEDGIVPRGRASAIGIALVDGQIVADMRRTLRADTVEFELGPFRTLADDEVAALQDAAADYGRFLDLDPVLAFRDP